PQRPEATDAEPNRGESLTVTSRYEALGHFANTSNTAPGTAGLLDYTPVGAPLVLGVGPTAPTGGGVKPVMPTGVSAIFSGLAAANGSLGAVAVRGLEGVRLAALPAGMGQGAAAASQGADLVYRYCFPAGTPVLLADGTARPIEAFGGGEWVLAAPDGDPQAAPRPARVARVFHNDPARLVTVHADGQAVRATAGHP